MPTTIELSLPDDLKEALQSTQLIIKDSLDREIKLAQDLDRAQLLNEAEASDYLRRNSDTLRYYRTRGLPYYKKGQDVWYRKGEIDDWLESGKVNRHNQ